jgi:ribosomal protein S18 acetylase RimI-like enzyme
MTDEISIREADVDDVDALSAIGHASFKAAYEDSSEPDDLVVHLQDFFSSRAILSQIQLPDRNYLIAMNGNESAGFVKISESTCPNELPASRALELNQVYVLPDQQRYGIGGLLITAAAKFAQDEAADGVWLTVWEDAPWAVNFYLKCGFERVGTTSFQLGKTVYEDLVMWRPV